MKIFKKCLMIALVIAALLPFALPAIEAEAATAGVLQTGDIYELGSYPQTKVTDGRLIAALNAQYASWVSYNYYNSAGVRGDYMKYKDVVYNGARYRAVKFSEYRPSSLQEGNSYHVGDTYWFKFESIKWTLLNAKTGYSICNQVVDSQAYHHTSASSNGYYANNYEKSDIRKWLLNDFYHTAFSNTDASYIKETELDNSAWRSTYSAAATRDRVFLLSRTELNNLSASYRNGSVTDYARVQGCPVTNGNYARYTSLRTAGGVSYGICYYTYGEKGCYGYNDKDDAIFVLHGTRPGIYLNIDQWNEKKGEEGTLANYNGTWYFVWNGAVDFSYTGLCKYSGSWYYVKDGRVSFSTTGLVKYQGEWWYVVGGKVASKTTTLVKYNNEWWYVVKGKVASQTTTLVKYGGEWWYVVGGKIASKTTTLVKYGGEWWYVVNGKIATKTTALVKYSGQWWYVVNGKIATKTTSLVKYNGEWWYVVNGKIASKTTSLVKYNGEWWYVTGGKIASRTTTLVAYNGDWYYIVNGKLATKTTTLVWHGGNWYYVRNGKVSQ